jgi:predicted kinase
MVGMVDRLVMVNGLPGSGKTTLATALAAALAVPLVSKDSIKELLADRFPAAPASSLGPIAMETAWNLVAAIPGTVIMESWWFRPRDLDHVKAGLERCCAALVVEIWCDVPADVARRRFAARNRPESPQIARRTAASWADWAAGAEPLGVGLTLTVRTDNPVDIGEVAEGVLGVARGYEF